MTGFGEFQDVMLESRKVNGANGGSMIEYTFTTGE